MICTFQLDWLPGWHDSDRSLATISGYYPVMSESLKRSVIDGGVRRQKVVEAAIGSFRISTLRNEGDSHGQHS